MAVACRHRILGSREDVRGVREKRNADPVEGQRANGVHYLCANDTKGKRYFVINSTNQPVAFRAAGVARRTTLSAERPTANSIQIYGKYGDTPGEINPIVPHEVQDVTLPPYSVNIVR